jgi:hypothetical protein
LGHANTSITLDILLELQLSKITIFWVIVILTFLF